jgi:benzoate membrane transport protein
MISAAVVAALVGYGSSVAIVLAAASALGATPAQTASWLLTVSLAKAAGSAFLSARYRVPVILAWSTPGAALIAAAQGYGMAEGVAAFAFAGLLILLTGALRPLEHVVSAIPSGIAAAMLAGVLLPFCLKGVEAISVAPALVLPMVAVFAAVRLANAAVAVLAALAAGLAIAFASGTAVWQGVALDLPLPVLVLPDFDPGALIGLGLPLYLVTMASQNLPGFATLRAAGSEPPVRPALTVTGALSTLAAYFGAHTVSMAAITAAICLGEDVDPDPRRRWRVGLVYALAWAALGLLSPAILALLAALPPQIMAALVAVALLGPLTGALTGAFGPAETRFPATITLAVTASGVALWGVGAAFWGLVAGLAFWALERLRTAGRPPSRPA